jgi:4,5-dihydroxyphthalate decarboxylase
MTTELAFAFGGAYDRIQGISEIAESRGLRLQSRVLSSPKDAFAALRDDPTLAGGEMSVSFYLTEWSRSKEDSALVALPVWVSRSFRHGNIYVREDSALTSPEQLRGRTVGLPEYGMTMAVWLRGLFADEYGVKASDVRWLTHRAPAGLAEGSVRYPDDVDIAPGPDCPLSEQLIRGDIDAWIGAGPGPNAQGVRRLFPDPHAEERDYFARTSIFPIMHVLVMRRSIVEARPDLATTVFGVFDEAKRSAQGRLWSTSVPYFTLPWALAAVEEQSAIMGHDPWPYGITANLPTLRALLGYMADQGLLWDEVDLEDCFLACDRRASESSLLASGGTERPLHGS